jgi:hypothetical protein
LGAAGLVQASLFYARDSSLKTGWQVWKNEWVKQSEITESLDGYAQGCAKDSCFLRVAGQGKQISAMATVGRCSSEHNSTARNTKE